jgi:hypothetical protein
VAVTSQGQKKVKVFTRKGALVERTFPETDSFTGRGHLERDLQRRRAAPDGRRRRGALGGRSQGGIELRPGRLQWRTGPFQKFIPNPASSSFQFTMHRRPPGRDGPRLLRRAQDHLRLRRRHLRPPRPTPCASVGDEWCGGWSSFLALADGTVVGAQRGSSGNGGCPLSFVGANLEISGSTKPDAPIGLYGMVESGADIAGLARSEVVFEGFLVRADRTTLATPSAGWG